MAYPMNSVNVNINQSPAVQHNHVVVVNQAPPPPAVIILQPTERQRLHEAFFREVVPSIKIVETNAKDLYSHLEEKVWKESRVMSQLRDIDAAVENIVLNLSLRFKAVVQDDYVQVFIVRSFKALARALEDLRNTYGGGCCCCCKKPFNNSKRVRVLAEKIHDKIAQVKADFRISINVGGATSMSGYTQTSMDISSSNSYSVATASPPAY